MHEVITLGEISGKFYSQARDAGQHNDIPGVEQNFPRYCAKKKVIDIADR